MNWHCGKCGLEFEGGSGPTAKCPKCGKILTYGPPTGEWDGFVFKPKRGGEER